MDLIEKFSILVKQSHIESETKDNVLILMRNYTALSKRLQKQFLLQNK